MSYLAPAGTVMSLGEIARGFGRGLFVERARQQLIDALRRNSDLTHCWPVSSGRAAMTLALQAMRAFANDPERDEVLIPAYTCYSVPASIARAGLRPRLCDVDPHTLGMDPHALDKSDFSRVLAVISANLYGIPNALPEIEAIARRRGILMLDDSAQSLGARYGARAVGAYGDAGLYSFDKGKIICTIQGGAIVSNNAALAAHIDALLRDLPDSTLTETLMNCAKLPVYALCLPPAMYGVVRRLPFLGLGRTEYETRYPIAQLSRPQTGVAAELSGRLDALNQQRRRNAAGIAKALQGVSGIALPAIATDAVPVYARFPMRILDPAARDNVVRTLDDAGIGATTSYPRSLADVPEVVATLRSPQAPMPGARAIAAQIVTLPTHGYCPPDLGERVRSILVGSRTTARVAA